MKLWVGNVLMGGVLLAVCGLMVHGVLDRRKLARPQVVELDPPVDRSLGDTISLVDREFRRHWEEKGVAAAPEADGLKLARRLALALVGTIPSLEEIRWLEALPEERRLGCWLDRLFEDRRYGDYLAERFARVLVGVEDGPFILYRRHRLVSWLSDQLMANRPYDLLVRRLIAAQGIWTSRPEVNFLTVTVDPGPNQVKLAGRVSRAFLGVRLDCVECHDDFLEGPWKQADFHQLAAFFAESELSLTGLRDDPTNRHFYQYRRQAEPEAVPARVPFADELLGSEGNLRAQLAGWVTHPDNRAFARTLVNRVWALMFGRPLVDPVDSVPLEGPFPPGMEVLADDFIKHGYDLRRLIRVIGSTSVFKRDSRSHVSASPVSPDQEAAFAAFPLSRLRPEQVAGSLVQCSQLRTLDAESHVFFRLLRAAQEHDFVKRYGDSGEREFEPTSGTVMQRLMMMNGDLVRERTKADLLMNASTRVGVLAPSHEAAVEVAYLTVLTRRPSAEESTYFLGLLHHAAPAGRESLLEDLFWILINSTEFSWNH